VVAISSKTQVLLASTFLFSLPLAVAYAFGLFMEVGSLSSAVIYFRKDIWSLVNDRRLLVYLLVVTTFTAIVGVPLYYLTDKVLTSNPYNLGIPMILLGLVLIGTGFYIKYSRTKPRSVGCPEEMKLKNYIIVGIAQGIAALPRYEQVWTERLDDAADGYEAGASLQTVISRLHSRFTRSLLRNSNLQPIPG
jgi:undecaprenyl-diphosphatase